MLVYDAQGAKWHLEAALLSRPVDLSALVSMSVDDPDALFEDDVLHKMVSLSNQISVCMLGY